MYIKSMVLDGFKSYGHRVEVCDLDKEFNAITGLNGTGKSNILDAICFVLGITNLSHVRASNLQDLVYKSGQAGITKASVSITFDNSDRSQCPIGYENQKEITITRQVVMGGKNKYMFNGIAVQQKRAHDFFNTIQLNVNNPHFLIMQGRITKVLNMKPQEILAMIEEAAGTRMYENKKQVAQKTIEKKDSKLQELNVIIREDIAPKLQKLQDERTQYQEYQKVVRELENLTKIHVAWRYVKGQAKSEEMTKKVQVVEVDIEKHKANIEGNKEKVIEIEAEITERHSRMESEDGTELRQLEAELVEKEEAEGVANNAHQVATEALQEHKRQEKYIERSLADDQKALGNNKKTLDGANNTFDSLREASERSAAELADAEARFVAISSGLEADTTSTASLQDQLMAAKREALEAETRITQAVMEKKHDDDRLLKLQRDFKSTSSQFQKDHEHIQQKEREVKKLQTDLEKLQESAERNQELKSRLHTLQNENRQKRYALERVQRQYPRYNFEYKDPTPNFDRSKVFGTVAQLVSVDDPAFYKALETVAGGRLYNVVIDDDRTGKLVLERGELKNRTTFIPLNRIQPHVLDDRVLDNARRVVGADKVWSALSLISYDQSVSRAVQFVFGSVLICSDIGVARTVAYHPSVKARCVTLDGDVADPRGGMSGGAMEREPPKAFEDFKTLRALEVELSRNEAELGQIEQEARRTNQSSESYNAARQRFELVSHELSVVKSRMENTSHHQMNEEIENLKKRVQELSAQIEEDKTKQKDANKLARELEVKMGDLKGHREREFKKAEENLQKAKVEAEKSNKLWRQREQEFNTLNLGVSELEKAVANGEKQLEEARATGTKLAQAVDTCEEALKEAKKKLKEMQKMIKDKKEEIAKKNKDISRIIRDKEKLLSANNDAKLKIKELEFQLESLNKEAQDCLNQIQHLANDNPWVESEKQYFGVSGGLYDFAVRDPVVAGQRLAQVRERKDKLSRGINARAHTLLSKEEEQYAELLNKKKIVEEDRKKLVQVIAELDEKKKRALQNAVRQVNLDFGSIFSTLLPGAQAKLQHAEGMTMIEGLEFKVGFNNTWKESLGELSGGQRSLVALSLILAMLLFKPAPVYILDEVDAALDLSHTQNIGTMLKHHFRRSQFIVVSLKDGMFNNANVLYRTRFVDGMSTVSRTVNTDNRDRTDQRNGH